MGRSDGLLKPVYQKLARQLGSKKGVAVLGSPGPYFVSDMFEDCEFFDLPNWNINSDWQLGKKYNLILSTRCPYFAKDPYRFIDKCYDHLNTNGALFVDWGYGDHWRFPDYKVGWVKNGKQEYCYGEDNFLWSGVWDESFSKHPQFNLYCEWVKELGYEDVKKSIYEETPVVMPLSYIQEYFNTTTDLLALWKERPQLYVFIVGIKV